ncbi:cyclic-phosphate processing receiver domain-containing protein [Paraburkholderia sp. BL17N1]|uniref:cyclic-phosphate processing receiver domain-containing protein n=1 Tax=Paraburkholderia sp. BL17N1 TaxID=1938798 RepID=UPI000EB43ACB|nr:cyclic-phosphate processing receiver domain-containing protein [Paraburkholderia sp. BL17N1]RKR45958.1 hypothetical protein B0G82_3626 [Paraburkholderia sp. BL17N1]
MGYRLFIDDLRDSVDPTWTIARSSAEAIALLLQDGCPEEISFDHDLGGEDTAMAVAKRLIDLDLDAKGAFIPPTFRFWVHSANPVGAANLQALLDRYLGLRGASADRA